MLERAEKLPSSSLPNGFTSNAVAIAVVNLFDGSIPEGKLPHPVDSAANARGQAQAGVAGGRMETVRPEIVITIQRQKHTEYANNCNHWIRISIFTWGLGRYRRRRRRRCELDRTPVEFKHFRNQVLVYSKQKVEWCIETTWAMILANELEPWSR